MVSKKNVLLLGIISGFSVATYLLISNYQGELGFPLDDAWIHQTYARNLAAGDGWSFFPGQPSAGLTAPLWGLLLALGAFLGLAPYTFTFFLGWLTLWALAVTGSCIMTIIMPNKPKWSLAAGGLLAVEWHLVWAAVSGMETLLYALFALVFMLVLLKEAYKKTGGAILLGALVGASSWVRPEGLTLLGPLLMVYFLSQISWQEKLDRSLGLFLGFGAIFVPYLLFNQWLAGEWWPNTFFAKQTEYAVLQEIPLWTRLIEQFNLPMVGVGILLLPGFFYLLVQAIRYKQWAVIAANLWMLGHFSLYAVLLPVTYQHGRYGIPAMPVYFILGFVGAIQLITLMGNAFLPKILKKTWKIVIPMTAGLFFLIGGSRFAEDVEVINSQMVTTAMWVSENIPENELIASHDIGALGYFTDHQILDLAGLISPKVIPIMRDEEELVRLLDQEDVTALMTFPSWYPRLILEGEIIFQADGNSGLVPKGDEMAIYCWQCNDVNQPDE